VFARPKAKKRTFRRLLKFPPLKANEDKIHVVESRINISASEVREKIRKGLSITKEVPAKIRKYIKEKGLYLGKK
jgi:nicotinate-nucleotide adenylyltransferase